MTPRYEHDCRHCVYLGTATAPSNRFDADKPVHERRPITADLYSCTRVHSDGRMAVSLIARYSSKGSDYASFPLELCIGGLTCVHLAIAAQLYLDSLGISGSNTVLDETLFIDGRPSMRVANRAPSPDPDEWETTTGTFWLTDNLPPRLERELAEDPEDPGEIYDVVTIRGTSAATGDEEVVA